MRSLGLVDGLVVAAHQRILSRVLLIDEIIEEMEADASSSMDTLGNDVLSDEPPAPHNR